MRTAGKLAAVASLLAGGIAPVVAMAPAAVAQAAPAYVGYHGVTGSQQVARFKELRGKGYRPLTVNVSAGPRYAAVWTKGVSSADWQMYQGLSAAELQKRFDAARAKGLQPISLSATGSGDDAVFATVYDKRGGKFQSRVGLTAGQFATGNKQAAAQGYVLSSVDVYGTADKPLYAAIWSANPGGAWYWTSGKSAAEHTAEFKARQAKGYRPTAVAVAPDGTYTAVWRKDGLRSWAHFIEMNGSGYQKRFDALKAKGLYPVQVNVENGRYAAIFVK